jgi:hypothetical protein
MGSKVPPKIPTRGNLDLDIASWGKATQKNKKGFY